MTLTTQTIKAEVKILMEIFSLNSLDELIRIHGDIRSVHTHLAKLLDDEMQTKIKVMTTQQQLLQVGTKFTMFNNKDYSATVTKISADGAKRQAVHYTLDVNGKNGWFNVDTLESAIRNYNIRIS